LRRVRDVDCGHEARDEDGGRDKGLVGHELKSPHPESCVVGFLALPNESGRDVAIAFEPDPDWVALLGGDPLSRESAETNDRSVHQGGRLPGFPVEGK